MSSYKHQKVVTYVISVVAFVAFILISGFALVWANGLTFDPKGKSFQQTAIIAVEPKLDNVHVLLNDREIGTQTPLQERSLPAGRYQVVIKKSGFRDYTKTFQLSTGQVGMVPDYVQLLAVNPTSEVNVAVAYKEHSSFDTGLSTSGDEILDQGVLITRLSSDPVLVRRFNQGYLYQAGRELRLYFPDNNSDELISTLPGTEPVKINVNSSSWQLSLFSDTDLTHATVLHLGVPSAVSAD